LSRLTTLGPLPAAFSKVPSPRFTYFVRPFDASWESLGLSLWKNPSGRFRSAGALSSRVSAPPQAGQEAGSAWPGLSRTSRTWPQAAHWKSVPR
jgi:hypothetical protein